MLRPALALTLLCAAVTTAAAPTGRTAPPAPRKSVAVLYFDNYTGKADYDPLGRGINRDLCIEAVHHKGGANDRRFSGRPARSDRRC